MARMTRSGRNRFRSKVSGALVAVLLFGGIVGLSSSEPAGAVGVTHKVTSASMTNLFPNAVEKPSISFSCNDVTGKFSFKITNVQVIQGDHVTPWPAPYQVAWLMNSSPLAPQPVALAQNATNGLYGAKSSGVMANVADCVTGAEIQVADWNTGASWTNFFMVFDGRLS
jgi:hypothetical protein